MDRNLDSKEGWDEDREGDSRQKEQLEKAQDLWNTQEYRELWEKRRWGEKWTEAGKAEMTDD